MKTGDTSYEQLVVEREEVSNSGKLHWIHWAVVLLSLVLTFFAWQFAKQQVEGRTVNQFNRASEQVLALVSERMLKYEDGLWGGVSAIQAHGGDMNTKEWQIFAESLRIDEKYPGINGIGVIHHVKPENLQAYLADQRQLRPEYRIHPKHSEREYMPITYVEPSAENAKAIGLDMAHEINRYAAAQAARLSGKAQITSPIFLVQDAGHTPGFLFYAPFYTMGKYETEQERIDNFVGMVYAPFVFHKLIEGVLGKNQRNIRISVKDGDQSLYNEFVDTDPEYDPKPMFTKTVDLDMYGKVWTFDISTTKSFRNDTASDQPTIILIGGILIDSLLLTLFVLLTRANRRAVCLADRMSSMFEQKAKALQKSNADLEQFAYVASHDLKAPLRAIDNLAKWIEEDAVDELSEDSRKNLILLRGRIGRLELLLAGLLKYSKAGQDNSEISDLDTHMVVSDVVDLLGVPESFEVDISSAMPSILSNKVPLQQVFQNLISNAIKHHDRESGSIEISGRDLGDYVEFVVADDGPGIPPQYHHKIFQMFQTLKRRDEVESSGLGLAVVKKLINAHGGDISVESTEGERGTKFRFTWMKGESHEEMKIAA